MKAPREISCWKQVFRTLAMTGLVAAFSACGGGGGGGSSGQGVQTPEIYANRVTGTSIVNSTGASPADWPFFFDTTVVTGPPGGGFDVLSLGYDPAAPGTQGGSLTVGFGDHLNPLDRICAVDGPGVDLAVFENPFPVLDGPSGLTGTNSEVATVEVSEDHAVWYEFPWSTDPAFNLVQTGHYAGLAGVTPVRDGGDRFDLAGLIAFHGLPPGFQACYLRLTDGGALILDYGNTQSDLFNSGTDIDAVGMFFPIAAPGLSP